jgi:hypothetical protein
MENITYFQMHLLINVYVELLFAFMSDFPNILMDLKARECLDKNVCWHALFFIIINDKVLKRYINNWMSGLQGTKLYHKRPQIQ